MGEQKDLWQRNVANLVHVFTGDYFTGRNLHTNFISDQNFFISIVTLLERNKKSLCSRLQVIGLCAKLVYVQKNLTPTVYDWRDTVKR